MNKNLAACDSFLSPLLPSPYLSPFPHSFRKQSDDLDQLLSFRLDSCPLSPAPPLSPTPPSPLPSGREGMSTRVLELEGESGPPELMLGDESEGSSRVR